MTGPPGSVERNGGGAGKPHGGVNVDAGVRRTRAEETKTVAVLSTLPAVRAGLRTLIESDRTCRVVADGATGAALANPSHASADVLVFDAEPGTDASDVVAAAASAPAVVILGSIAGDERLPSLLDRPFAYLPRDASREQLLAALTAVTHGLLVLDPSGGERLFSTPLDDAPRAASADGTADQLTAREREVLQLVAEGLPNKTVARRLGISDHTVKFHVAALMSKLNATTRTEAVHQAARRGLVSL